MRRIFLPLVFLSSCLAVHIPGVPQEFTSNDIVLSAISDEIARKFAEEYINFIERGIESIALRQISTQLANAHSQRDFFTKGLPELSLADQFVACTTCRATVNVIAHMFRDDDGEFANAESELKLKNIAMDVCARLELQTPEVCDGAIELNLPTLVYIAKQSKIDSRTFCSLFMEFNFCNVKNTNYNWTLAIDGGGAAVTGPKSVLPAKNGNELQILHLTDFHYDPLYAPGSLAECVEPQCCQRGAGSTESDKAAGYWGDYRHCDAPWHMIDDTLNHIRKTHSNIDYIYQTGDVVDHMIWSSSVEKNTAMLKKVNKRLAELFPGVPVYSCIGNHEPHVVNLFSPDNVSENINTRWLYELLYEQWSIWLPADTKDTILRGGYYTASPKSGLRVIALNNNDCSTSNWWLFYEGTNKIPQLQWLHDTLLAAERAGEFVHILAHIPTGDGNCWSVWAREFNRLVERFRNTISGIFNGHSHQDEMHLHYSANGHAIGVVWNGGSLTTYTNKNPNYRLYQVETTSMQVVDHETWIFNLTEANAHGESQTPNWFKEYVFSTEFTADLSPAGIDTLLDEMAENPTILRKFWKYKSTSSDPKLNQGCDRTCLLRTICRLATTVNTQKTRCEQLQEKLVVALDNERTTIGSTVESTTSPTPATGETTTERGGDGDGDGDGAASLRLSIVSLISSTFLLAVYNY